MLREPRMNCLHRLLKCCKSQPDEHEPLNNDWNPPELSRFEVVLAHPLVWVPVTYFAGVLTSISFIPLIVGSPGENSTDNQHHVGLGSFEMLMALASTTGFTPMGMVGAFFRNFQIGFYEGQAAEMECSKSVATPWGKRISIIEFSVSSDDDEVALAVTEDNKEASNGNIYTGTSDSSAAKQRARRQLNFDSPTKLAPSKKNNG